MERHFCATVYIIEENKVLLIFHRKLQKWLPPGGHLDPNETPPDGAKREVREETGLEVDFFSHENISIQDVNATSFERPFMCLLENIPAYGNQPAHQHMDFIYIARPIGGTISYNSNETEGIRWFTYEEIEREISEKLIYSETKQSIKKIFELYRAEPTFS